MHWIRNSNLKKCLCLVLFSVPSFRVWGGRAPQWLRIQGQHPPARGEEGLETNKTDSQVSSSSPTHAMISVRMSGRFVRDVALTVCLQCGEARIHLMPHVQLMVGLCETPPSCLCGCWCFQLQELGFGPRQHRGWQRAAAVFVWNRWRRRHALLHLARHPHRGAPVLGAGSRGVPRPGGSARGRQAHAAADRPQGLPDELHVCRPRQPAGSHRGTLEKITVWICVLTDKQTPFWGVVSPLPSVLAVSQWVGGVWCLLLFNSKTVNDLERVSGTSQPPNVSFV